MSHAISVALGRDKVFAPGSQEHISARSITDGYHALHAIVRSVHPALNPYQRSCTPVQRPEESFLSFVTRMKTYAYDECVSFRNGHYEDRQLILLTLGNCHPRYAWVVQLFFKDRVLRLEPGDMLPFELHMDQMAGTLDQAVARVGLCPLHSSSRHGTDRDIYGNDADDDDVDELSMDDQIELCIYRRLAATTASSSKTVGGDCCRISHNTGHAMDECCSLVVHVLATLELVDQPAVRGRILDKQKRIVGTPGS